MKKVEKLAKKSAKAVKPEKKAAKVVKLDKKSAKSAKTEKKADKKAAKPAKAEKAVKKNMSPELKKLMEQYEDKCAVRNQCKEDLELAKEALDKAEKSVEALQTKVDALQQKEHYAALAKAGVSFEVICEKKVLGKAKTLEKAMDVKVKDNKAEVIIYAVKGSRKEKVMQWSAKDFITNRRFKGYSWFYLSEEMLNKFGSPQTKRWLEQRKEAQANGTLNPFAKKK